RKGLVHMMKDVHKPGRPSKPVRVADVRTLPCPSGGLSWGALDADARKPAEPAPKVTRCHCGVTLMSERRWAEAATEGRQESRAEGFAPRASGMCDRCARRVRAAS